MVNFQKIALDLQTEMQAAITEAEKIGALANADLEAAADALMEKIGCDSPLRKRGP
jgi:hypothetical protein